MTAGISEQTLNVEQIREYLSNLHPPCVTLIASVESDTIVRTTTNHTTTMSLFSSELAKLPVKPALNLCKPDQSPPLSMHASQTLAQALAPPSTLSNVADVVSSYSSALESVTAVANHTHFRTPVIHIIAAWSGEPLPALPSVCSATTHVVLIRRHMSRQDDAALQNALPAMHAIHGEANVHVLRLFPSSRQDGENDNAEAFSSERLNTIAQNLEMLARDSLQTLAKLAISSAERSRRSARTTFRSWFSGSATTPVLLPPSSIVSSSSSPVSSSTNLTLSSSSRRTSFSAAARVPQFETASMEYLTRRAADFSFMTGQYSVAADMYNALATDCRSLSGISIVHEAAAIEMTGLARLCLGAPLPVILTLLDRAVMSYARAFRPELAVRVSMRTTYLLPNFAVSILLRAREMLTPDPKPMPLVLLGSAFTDVALAVLSTACTSCYTQVHKFRRASFYAFVAMQRFSSLQFPRAAACLAGYVDSNAMLRASVLQHVNLILAANSVLDGNVVHALKCYTRVLSDISENTDVELQSVAVRGLLSIGSGDSLRDLPTHWDAGVLFPPIIPKDTQVVTTDSDRTLDHVWSVLEDDVLEDVSFFNVLRREGRTVPKRPRRVECYANELRKQELKVDKGEVGGSLETKIQRLREIAQERRLQLRKASLLEGCAVVGERIRLDVKLKNPLQFPVFLNTVCPVVSLDGTVVSYSDSLSKGDMSKVDERSSQGIKFFPVNDFMLAPCSSQIISVEIIVTCSGTLRFIGMTWHFTIGMGNTTPKAPIAMPGFCPLQRQGKRLNVTRKQRASDTPIYAEDTTLFVTVVEKVPRLRTELRPKDGNKFREHINGELVLRAGEIREARLIFYNDSDISVSEVNIRTGTPQTIFVDVAPILVTKGDTEVACAVGMDDGLVSQQEVFAASATKMFIEANGQVEIPVWLQASVPSALFSGTQGRRRSRRELVSGEHFALSQDGALQCIGRVAVAYGGSCPRVSRINICFKVIRSIIVSPRFMRDTEPETVFGNRCAGLEGVLLGVEVEHAGRNAVENVKFDISELSVSSCGGWRPMFLPCPQEPDEFYQDSFSPSPSSLRINETATIFILIVRKVYPTENTNGFTNVQLNSSETEQSINVGGSCINKLWETFRVQLDSSRQSTNSELREGEKIGGLYRASSHFALCARQTSEAPMTANEKELAHVSVRWHLNDGHFGEILVPPIDPVKRLQAGTGSGSIVKSDSNETLSPQVNGGIHHPDSKSPDREDTLSCYTHDPITVHVQHDTELEHDFFKDSSANHLEMMNSVKAEMPVDRGLTVSPAEVPIRVSIRNSSIFLLDVSFSVTPVGGISDGDRGRHWAGDVSMSMRSLPPGAERTILLSAVFVAPGQYNVSKFNVLCQNAGSTLSEIARPVPVRPSFVTVRAVGKSADLTLIPSQKSPSISPLQSTVEKGGAVSMTSNGDLSSRMSKVNEELISLGKPEQKRNTAHAISNSSALTSDTTIEAAQIPSTVAVLQGAEQRGDSGADVDSTTSNIEGRMMSSKSAEPSELTHASDSVIRQKTRTGRRSSVRQPGNSKIVLRNSSIDDSLWDDGDSDEEDI